MRFASVYASLVLLAANLGAQVRDTSTRADTTRPFVRGGVYDKPMLGRLAGRIAIGGYAELHARYERADGVLEESGFVAKRFNLFVNSRVSDVVRFGAELEFEDGAEEIALEFAAIDLRLHRSAVLRAGIILTPLGRFNLAHDSPLNEFTDRPLVATELIGSALSEAGVGMLGEFGVGAGRLTYEAYATNGFHDGLLLASSAGTRIERGRKNLEDNNSSPAFTGRVAWSPSLNAELGVSGHRGAYNVFQRDGVRIDAQRNVSIGAVDVELQGAGFRVQGEAIVARVDLPPSIEGLFAGKQRGAYAEVARDFFRGFQRGLPNSLMTLKLRGDAVDFDSSIPGDMVSQLSVGVNYRPTPDTVIKFDFVRGRSRDRFNNSSEHAKLLASVATYF